MPKWFFLYFCSCVVVICADDSASKCYFCDGECQDPLWEIACRNMSNIQFGCISAKGVLGPRNVEFKGCVDLNNTIDKDNCNKLNGKEEGSCYICTENLCNSAKNLGSKFVIMYLFAAGFNYYLTRW